MADRARRGRRDSAAAQHLDGLFEEMRTTEARSFLLPIVKHMRAASGLKDVDNTNEISKRDLQQLAVSWKMTQMPDFWKQYPTVDDLLRVLYKHAKKLKEGNVSAPYLDALHHPSKPKAKAAAPVATVKVTEDWRKTLGKLGRSFGMEAYTGDLFGSRGDYDEGIIYLSRSPVKKAPTDATAAAGGYGTSATAADKSAASAATRKPGSVGFEDSMFSDADASTEGDAFEALRLTSTSTLVDISQTAELRKELADPSALQILFDTWRAATQPQIRRNCAVTLANLFSTVPMPHDDLLLPILGICTSDSSVSELSACCRALTQRSLQSRPIDVLFVPSILTAVMCISRKENISAQVRAECALILLQLLERCVDTEGQGAPESLVEAVNAIVTGGLSTIANSQPPKSPKKDLPPSPPSRAGPDSPRKLRTNKSLSRVPPLKSAIITPAATAAAQDAVVALSSRPSFRLTAVLSGVASYETQEALAKDIMASSRMLERQHLSSYDLTEVDEEADHVVEETKSADFSLPADILQSKADALLVTRVAMEYGLLSLLLALTRSCMDGLAALGHPTGVVETAKPAAAAACVPSERSSAAATEAADTASDAAYLTDGLEYCIGCFVRVARLNSVLSELSSKQILLCLLQLTGMCRQSVRDGAARVLYCIAASDDAALVHDFIGFPDAVNTVAHLACLQAQELQAAGRITAPCDADPSTPVDLDDLVVGDLQRICCRALLCLSTFHSAVHPLVHSHAGHALMTFYLSTDYHTKRWALLGLCSLFELSDSGREDLLKLGFLPVMMESVSTALEDIQKTSMQQQQRFGKAAQAQVTTTTQAAVDGFRADRFANHFAASSCAIAICALTGGNAAVVTQLLDHDLLTPLAVLAAAAERLVREGIAGVGAKVPPVKKIRRQSTSNTEQSSAPPEEVDESFYGVPPVFRPKVLASAIAAIANLCNTELGVRALLPNTNDTEGEDSGRLDIIQSVIRCVPAKSFLTQSQNPIPRHVTDDGFAEWHSAEVDIQTQAVDAVCSLCAFEDARVLFAKYSNETVSGVELLCRIAGTVANVDASNNASNSSHVDTGRNQAAASGAGAAQLTSPKGVMMRQASFRLGRAGSAGTEEIIADAPSGKAEQKHRERPKPIEWEESTKENCLYQVCCLSAYSSSHRALIQLGCIPALITHIRHVHSRMRKECAQAVYNLTSTLLEDTTSLAEACQRLRLIIDADLAAALTIGSLFRADDDKTRDLCAAAMYNVLSATFMLPLSEKHLESAAVVAATTANGSGVDTQREGDATERAPALDVEPSIPPPRDMEKVMELRHRLLKDGLLWAVIKLAQGLKSTENGSAEDTTHPRWSRLAASLISPQLLQGRFMTTATLMRNLAADAKAYSEVARKHSIVMLFWYAKQCAASLHIQSDVETVATHLSTKMTEQARRNFLATLNLSNDEDVVRTSSQRGDLFGDSALECAMTPCIMLTVSQIACLLSQKGSLCKQLVANGVLVALARMLDVTLHICADNDAPTDAVTWHRRLSVSVSVLHRVVIAVKNIANEPAARALMYQQGPLCVAVLHTIFACALNILKNRTAANLDVTSVVLEATSEYDAQLNISFGEAMRTIFTSAAAAMLALSADASTGNVIAEHGMLDLCCRVVRIGASPNEHLPGIAADEIHSDGPDPPPMALAACLVDAGVRSVFNLFGNGNGVAVQQVRTGDANIALPTELHHMLPDCGAVELTPRKLVSLLLHGVQNLGQSGDHAYDANPTIHAELMVCISSVLSRLCGDETHAPASLELHDPQLLTQFVHLCETTPTSQLLEASSVALCGVLTIQPSRYVPLPVLQYLVDCLATSQLLPSGIPPNLSALSSSVNRTSRRATLLSLGGSSPAKSSQIRKQPSLSSVDMRGQLLTLNFAAAAAIVRCFSCLLRAKPTIDSKPSELTHAAHTKSTALPEPKPGLQTDDHTSKVHLQTPSPAGLNSDETNVAHSNVLRRNSSFGAEPATTTTTTTPATTAATAPASKSQVSQASLMALKSLIERDHEEAARRARVTESPHLRILIACGIIDAVSAVELHARAYLKARGKGNKPVAVRAGSSEGSRSPNIRMRTTSMGGRASRVFGGVFDNMSDNKKAAATPSTAAASQNSSNNNSMQEQIKWVLPSQLDQDVSRFLAVLQYLCCDSLLTIAKSPDAKGCLLGLELQGPKPLTYDNSDAAVDGSQLRAAGVDMLGMKPTAGIHALAAVAKSGRIALQRMAAEGMSLLTQTHPLRVLFLQERAAAVLASLARRSTSDAITQKWCGAGLRNLSDDVKLRSSVLEAGGMVEGALMLLPDAAAAGDAVKDDRRASVISGGDNSARDGGNSNGAGAARRPLTSAFPHVGVGLDVRHALESEPGTEDCDNMWSDDEANDIDDDEEGDDCFTDTTVYASMEKSLQLQLFHLPRSWLPPSESSVGGGYPSLSRLLLCLRANGSGATPDADAVARWEMHVSMLAVPENSRAVADADAHLGVHPQGSDASVSVFAGMNFQTVSQQRWSDILGHWVSAIADEDDRHAMEKQLQSITDGVGGNSSVNNANSENNANSNSHAKLPDSAFRHRVQFEKDRAYERELPVDVSAADIPNFSEDAVPADGGLTDVVAKELAAKGSMLHDDSATRRAVALLKPFALPETELNKLLVAPDAEDPIFGSNDAHNNALQSGFLISQSAYAMLRTPDEDNRYISSPLKAATSPVRYSKEPIVMHLGGKLEGNTFVASEDGQTTTSRQIFRNDAWNSTDRGKSAGSVFDRLISRSSRREATTFRSETTNSSPATGRAAGSSTTKLAAGNSTTKLPQLAQKGSGLRTNTLRSSPMTTSSGSLTLPKM